MLICSLALRQSPFESEFFALTPHVMELNDVSFGDNGGSGRDEYHENFDLSIWIPLFIFASVCFLFLIFSVGYLAYEFRTAKLDRRMKAYSLLTLFCFIIASIFYTGYTINAKFQFGILNRATESFWSFVEYTSTFCFFRYSDFVVDSYWNKQYNTFWSMSYLFTYLFLFRRQRTIFNRTHFEITRGQTIIFYILAALYFIAQQIMLSEDSLYFY